MAIYVDGGRYQFKRMVMCHMLADTILELHEMAAALGMKRVWFQPASFPHYDLSQSKRFRAVHEFGAIEVTRHELVDVMRRTRESDWWDAWHHGAMVRAVP